uniref:Olfactory receptor n=2 Tax=Tetraodon nigroviridis TaxID=99883 RepID=Q2PR49_TETNG|nr:odorant receptor [Tetraodon nigroviridis]
MEPRANVSYITVDGYVEVHRYRYLYFVLMLTAYLLILCTNSTVVYLICLHRDLHQPMYVLIAALLLNSVIYSSTIYPKLLQDFLSEEQTITYSACLFQYFAFYSLAGSEFLLLAVMAYDRYVAICTPLRYPAVMRRRRVAALLLLAWVAPSILVVVPTITNANKKLCHFVFKGIICNSTIYDLLCQRSQILNIYGLIVLVNLVILPVIFILFSYIRILLVSYQSSREVRRKAAQTCLPHLLILINFSSFGIYDVLLLRLNTTVPKTVRFLITLQMIMYQPLFNPIIYGLKMREISKHLKKLFARKVLG